LPKVVGFDLNRQIKDRLEGAKSMINNLKEKESMRLKQEGEKNAEWKQKTSKLKNMEDKSKRLK
jgi:hypothetical protein